MQEDLFKSLLGKINFICIFFVDWRRHSQEFYQNDFLWGKCLPGKLPFLIDCLCYYNNCCIKVFQYKERGDKYCAACSSPVCLLDCNQWELPDYVWHHLQGPASPAACDTHQDRLEQDPKLQNWQGDAECLVDCRREGGVGEGCPRSLALHWVHNPPVHVKGLTKAKRYRYGGRNYYLTKV